MIVIAVVLQILCVIANDSKDKPQKLSGYGNQGLHLEHAPVQHLLILLMHDAFGFNRIDGRKKQQFSHQRSASFGDAALAPVFARTDFIKIKAGQFHDFREGIKFFKVCYFSDQPGNGHRSKALDGKYVLTIRNLRQINAHLFFQTIDKLILGFYAANKMLNFKNDTLFTRTDSDTVSGGLMKLFGTILAQFAAADLFQLLIQRLKTQSINFLWRRVMLD